MSLQLDLGPNTLPKLAHQGAEIVEGGIENILLVGETFEDRELKKIINERKGNNQVIMSKSL